jgi:TolA-binding protein
MMRSLLPLLAFMLLSGCGDERRSNTPQQPYLMGQSVQQRNAAAALRTEADKAVAIAKIEAQSREEIARINREHDLEMQKLQQQTAREKISAEKEVALRQNEAQQREADNGYTLGIAAIAAAALLFAAVLALSVYFLRKRREDRLKMHSDTLEQERSIKEKELQVRMAEKILDTLASGTLSKEEEARLIETFEKTNRGLPYNRKS